MVFGTKPVLITTVSPVDSRAGRKAQVPGPEISSRTAEPYGHLVDVGVHFGARSTSWPGAALWWNCKAINSDFIARNGHSVTARVSGSHSAACSQNGG